MKNYLAVFIGSNTSPKVVEFMAMEEGKRKKLEASGMKAWGEWMAAHNSDIVASEGLSVRRSARPRRASRT